MGDSMVDKQKVTFLGLGVMGFPMAGHLANAGHQVTVYNRTASRAEAWLQKYQGQRADTPAAAAKGAAIVFACVGNDDDLRSIVYGDKGALAGMSAGTIFVDHTTASAEVAREVSAAAGKKARSIFWTRRYRAGRRARRTAN
jgi:3-hydroxyisobutyrate dehydrogenase-like beta-hydroxyacid dehydrogenase